nr:hypothetical protein GCM10020093_038100 [Planobispora longispora]
MLLAVGGPDLQQRVPGHEPGVVVAPADAARLHVDDPLQVRAVLGDLQRLVHLLLVLGDEDLRPGVGEQVGDLGRRVGGIEADRDAAHRDDAEVGVEPLAPVLGVHGHPVAGLDAEREQGVRDELDVLPVVGPGDLLPDAEVLLPHGDPAGRGPGPVADPGDDGRGARVLLLACERHGAPPR